MNDKLNLLTEQSDVLLKVYNQRRHDWLNHFQVLLGYLKLGRPEQGVAYLERVTEMTCQESTISHINCSRLSVFFLTFNALHNDLLLEVEVDNQVDLSLLEINHDDLFRLVTSIVFTAKEHLCKDKYEIKSMLISLAADEQTIQFRFDLAAALHESGIQQVEKLIEESKLCTATVSEWSHTSEELILQLNFPIAVKKR